MLPPEGQTIIELVGARMHNLALGVSPGASVAEINKAHLRLLAKWKDYPEVVEALNLAKVGARAAATPAAVTPAAPPRPSPQPQPASPRPQAASPAPRPASPQPQAGPRPQPEAGGGAPAGSQPAKDPVEVTTELLTTPTHGLWGSLSTVAMFMPVRLALTVLAAVILAAMPGLAVKWVLAGLAVAMVVSARSREGAGSLGFLLSVFAFAGVGFYLAVSTVLAATTGLAPVWRAVIAVVLGIVLPFVPGFFLIRETVSRLGRPTLVRSVGLVGVLAAATFCWAHLAFTPAVTEAVRSIPAWLVSVIHGKVALLHLHTVATVGNPALPNGAVGWLLAAALALVRLGLFWGAFFLFLRMLSGARGLAGLGALSDAGFAWIALAAVTLAAASLELVYYLPKVGPYMGSILGIPHAPPPGAVPSVAGVFVYFLPQYLIVLPVFVAVSRLVTLIVKSRSWVEAGRRFVLTGALGVSLLAATALLHALGVNSPFEAGFANFLTGLWARLGGPVGP